MPRASSDAGDASPLATFRGRYGPWTLTQADVNEVLAYRASLTLLAASFDVAAAASVLPDQVQRTVLDPALFVGAASLGSALVLVHMYLAPIKRTMQALWLVGVIGCVGLAATQELPVAQYVAQTPSAVWAVGPLFAALTGLCFKEGACYGSFESVGLFFAVPALLLSKLAGAPDALEAPLLALVAVLLTIWAARKFSQEVKDDIGDKSIFDHLALSPEEQAKREAELGN